MILCIPAGGSPIQIFIFYDGRDEKYIMNKHEIIISSLMLNLWLSNWWCVPPGVGWVGDRLFCSLSCYKHATQGEPFKSRSSTRADFKTEKKHLL